MHCRYFAAQGQIHDVNIYNETISPYEDIDDGYIVPEISGSLETRVKDDEEDNQDEDVSHYLELD